MTIMTGGEGLVSGLIEHGIDTVFGLPGVQTYGLFDALHRAAPGIKVVGARHEQTCGYMALGYARSTGRPAVFTVVPGPGMLNAAAAMLTAQSCNEPVLLLTGQVPTRFLDRGRGHLHEMRDQLATMRSIVKWAERVDSPALSQEIVARAFQAMLSGRRGAAALEMPWDVFAQQAELPAAERLTPFAAPAVDTDQIEQAARLIKSARRPMIFVGSGAIHAREAVLALGDVIDAPVVAFRSGRGIVGNDHELGLSIAAAFELWKTTDLAIGIGTRLELPHWRWSLHPEGLKWIRVDIDPAEIQRSPPDVAVLADSNAATQALVDAVGRVGSIRDPSRREEIRAVTARTQAAIQAVQPQMAYLNVIRELLPRDGFFVEEATQVGFTSWFGFPTYEPRTFVSTGYQGTLGFGFPTALGVKVANPDRVVISVTGDGGFLFAATELATAVQYGIGVVVLVFNNGAYGNVLRDQRGLFAGRTIAAELTNPDFVKFADSFGVDAERVENPDAFRGALERALVADGPRLIEITVKDEESPWRFIHQPNPRLV